MKRARWACSEVLGLAWSILLPLALAGLGGPARAAAVAPVAITVQVSPAQEPTELMPQWAPIGAPVDRPADPVAGVAWIRVEFELPPQGSAWTLYLPILYDGARLWLNGQSLASIPGTTAQTHVRWDRAGLFNLPDSQLRAGRNELLLRTTRTGAGATRELALPIIGRSEDLLPTYDRRMFWARTMPQATVATCLVVGLFVGFVWLRRRSELLYGLFGLAVVLWGLRTLTFVVEVMPASWWPWWRVLYHASTGGFIIVLALFAMRFSGVRWPRVERLLIGYGLIGPLLVAANVDRLENPVRMLWTAGLIPIGLVIVAFTGLAAWRQRSGGAVALLAAVVLAVAAGIHDYVMALPGRFALPPLVSDWMAQRIFLLHVGADLVLLVMVGILALRFVQALDTAANLNRDLERRVAEREHELQLRHAQMAALAREQATSEERQRIMQDLHDGLGSQMFTALLRAERGDLDSAQLAQALRDCIADMRLTFEVVSTEGRDFLTALVDFRFRWEEMLRSAGLDSQWQLDLSPRSAELSPAVALQVLRVAQEALTNALKHGQATRVEVAVSASAGRLTLAVIDDGRGIADGASPRGGGRGLSNMRQRAQRIGAALDIESRPGRTRVTLSLPLVAAG